MVALTVTALALLTSAANAQTIKLRMPLNDAGPGTNMYSDTLGGGSNVTMTMVSSTGTATDYHGGAGSGLLGGTSQAMDFSTGMAGGAGPLKPESAKKFLSPICASDYDYT